MEPVTPEDPRIRLLVSFVSHVKDRASSGAYSDVNRRRLVEVLERLGLAVDPATGKVYPTRRFVTRL